ncbi:MAG: hypothetical protein HY776_04250 [Actinobacteria bacterium]|nr:hypothetical protein [Actinomycetota bacterium]
MPKNKILKIKLGNNPTSSASTYQLLPTVYSAVKLAVWFIWSFLGVGVFGLLPVIRQWLSLRKESDKIFYETAEKLSVVKTISLSLLFIRRKFRSIFNLIFKVSLFSFPLNVILMFSLFYILGYYSEGAPFQQYINYMLHLFLAGILPAYLIASSVAHSLKEKKSKFEIRMNILVFIIVVVLILISSFIIHVAQQLPIFSKDFGITWEEIYQIPEIGFGVSSIPYLLGLILFVIFMFLVYKAFIINRVREVLYGETKDEFISSMSRFKIFLVFWISFSLSAIIFIVEAGVIILMGFGFIYLLDALGPKMDVFSLLVLAIVPLCFPLIILVVGILISFGAVIPAISMVFANFNQETS